VGEEVEFLRAWMDVQKARFGDRLEVEWAVEESSLSARIPAMGLETLVENALKHGVARSRSTCRVTISGRVADHRLLLEVRDGGPGPLESGSGHGLRNIRERLAGYYGDKARLELSREGEETVARMELPL